MCTIKYAKAVLAVVFLAAVLAVPVYADEPASTPAPTATSAPETNLADGLTGAWDDYGGQLAGGLDDVQGDTEGVVSDSVLQFFGSLYTWIPSELLLCITLGVACTVVLAIIRTLQN